MPITPPKLDDRGFDDIVREARALIPQYCPEWTNLGDADPGMTLVQLFAWMTEMTLFRLNRVPDKTYVHFLNFIGEERRTAQPARVPLTFRLRDDTKDLAEVPLHAKCSTRQRDGGEALHFVTTEPLSVHGAVLDRVIAVQAGEQPRVRELPLLPVPERPAARMSADPRGVRIFDFDEALHGPDAYTAAHHVYLRHPDLALLAEAGADDRPVGLLRVRSSGVLGLPVGAMFDWSYPTGDPEAPDWRPLVVDATREGTLEGLPEVFLGAALPDWTPIQSLGPADDPAPLPDGFAGDVPVVRGTLQFERWLAERMRAELSITWQDDWGAEPREVTTWSVREVGRALEWFVRDLPPVRSGWTLRLTMTDHGLPSGKDGYFPRYRWSYRRRDRWVTLPPERIELQGSVWVISGPLPDMVADGYNLRAERMDVVHIEGLLPALEVDLAWERPIELHFAAGPETDAAAPFAAEEFPRTPFQPIKGLPALLGMKMFVGSELLAHRAQHPLELQFDVSFERQGVPVPEPTEDYHLQLCYRTANGWEVVPHAELNLEQFRFADIDPDGAEIEGRRTVRLAVDPAEHLVGLSRAMVAGQRTAWLRLELTRAALTYQKDEKTPPVAISLKLHRMSLELADKPGARFWSEPLPGTRVATLEHRPENRRFTRVMVRREGKVRSTQPFDEVLATAGEDHKALYLHFDRVLPSGGRLATLFRSRGETLLPADTVVAWEALSGDGEARRWRRVATGRPGDEDAAFCLDGTGVLGLELSDPVGDEAGGTWVRAVFRTPEGDDGRPVPLPPLPPLTHILPNTVEGMNLHAVRMEKYSGYGVPHQAINLRRFPVFLPPEDDVAAGRHVPGDLVVMVEEDEGERRPWRMAVGNSFSTAGKEDRVFVVDPVEGVLRFGNGLRGRLLPVGSYNISIERYFTVPGNAGNVAAGLVEMAEGLGDLVDVHNVLPARGGMDAESIEDILQRAPSILTSRDRAVTRADFEVIAAEASAEVARAACKGMLADDGTIEVLILPVRPSPSELPDPFLSASLVDRVHEHLGARCLVNVRPQVRLARFLHVDVSLALRRRPNTNPVAVREAAEAWVRRFLDPYVGGLESDGWPFAGTLFAQDFGRLVRDVDDVRHVGEVQLYPLDAGDHDAPPGWEVRQGRRTLTLDEADLFAVRHVRIAWVDGAQ